MFEAAARRVQSSGAEAPAKVLDINWPYLFAGRHRELVAINRDPE